ncbi:MAG TPA: hypothetical protein VFV94_11685 [Polyangiaceae bacterium]|jgi:hypothetical protein|nr:hypothetical protein [Polyangiaceae bacterium]
MRLRAIVLSIITAATTACTQAEPHRKSTVEEEIAAAVAAGAIEKDARQAAHARRWAPPNGPMLAIEAGKGVGAIRIGATVATIERLMDKRCEVLTEELCRYITRGVDFHLVGGITNWIHVQRAGRPAGNDFRGEPVEFGFFNGAIPPDVRLGMIPSAIQEYLGPPERIEPVPQPNPASLVARDYYPGMVIEYDRYTNGKIILGGVRIMKDPLGRPGYEYVPRSAAIPGNPVSGENVRNRDVVR